MLRQGLVLFAILWETACTSMGAARYALTDFLRFTPPVVTVDSTVEVLETAAQLDGVSKPRREADQVELGKIFSL